MEGTLLHGIEGVRARLSTVATRADLDAQFKAELTAKLTAICERLVAGEIDVHRDGLYRYIARRRSAI